MYCIFLVIDTLCIFSFIPLRPYGENLQAPPILQATVTAKMTSQAGQIFSATTHAFGLKDHLASGKQILSATTHAFGLK